MAMCVLVHGGAHCSWHWHRLRPVLERLGHKTIAPDVPMDDPSAGAGDWAVVIVKAIADAGERDDVVLVGHSLAGLALPLVAAHVPVRRMVFLCANVPVPGRSYEEYLAEHPDAVIIPPLKFDEQGRLTVSWDVARELFYGDCDEALAREAYEHLVPSAALVANRERCPLDSWPEVPSSYILCKEDRIIGPSWSRRASIERLGCPAIELPGSHSPFLAQPERLAKVLEQLATE
jgi:pimeloyl-ACP methyl ester carboxylesterase